MPTSIGSCSWKRCFVTKCVGIYLLVFLGNLGIAFSRDPRKDVIMALTNRLDSAHYVWTFVSSFRKVNKDAALVIFAPQSLHGSIKAINTLDELNVTLVAYNSDTLGQPATNYRFYMYQRFLKSNIGIFDRVIASDLGDIYFQADPFQGCTAFRSNAFFMSNEDERYVMGVDPNNVKCVGQEASEAIKRYPLMNDGFVGGSAQCFLAAIDVLIPSLQRSGPGCLDQPMLIHKVLSKELIFALENVSCTTVIPPSRNDCVATLAIPIRMYPETMWMYYDKSGKYIVQYFGGPIVPAVHMYNRNETLTRIVRHEMFPYPV